MADAYLRQRQVYRAISDSLAFAASQTTKTLVACPLNFTIYIQRIFVTITTDAAQTLTFQDSNGLVVAPVITGGQGANLQYVYDFGALGTALGAGFDFQAVFSAAGLAGVINWEGYTRLTGATHA